MKTAIVIIDMQNDFIHKNGSLCVPNGNKAAKNIANFLKENDVDKIFVSRDYHPKNNIASTEFWYDSENKHVEPFTEITLDDVLSKKVRTHYYKAYLIAYLKELEKKGKKLIAWPPHCVENTWGCEICNELKEVLGNKDNVEYIKKGTNPNTEHYSIFKAEIPLAGYSVEDGCIYAPYILETTNIPTIGNISEEIVQGINTGRYWNIEREYPIRKLECHKTYCIDCGIQIDKNAKRCIKCENIRRKEIGLKNTPVSKDKLNELINKYSFTEIGRMFNVSYSAIKKWCKKYELPYRKKDIKSNK